MRFISHRGNLTGPTPFLENHPTYIQHALDEGVDVEIDIWYTDGQFYLGHDEPQSKVPEHFFTDDRLWFHCKNVEALYAIEKREFFQGSSIKYFWHQEDDVALTSNKMIWTYPGKLLVPNSIAVLPEIAYSGDLWSCYAICTDEIYQYRDMYKKKIMSLEKNQ
jgi:hypothetical protein